MVEKDDVVGLLRLGEVDGAEQRVGREEHVGVGEEQPGSRGLTRGESHGVRLAEPSGREVGDVDDGQAGWDFGGDAGCFSGDAVYLCGDAVKDRAG